MLASEHTNNIQIAVALAALPVDHLVLDGEVKTLAQSRHPPATVVGAYSPSTGAVTAGASRGGGLGCAEGVCAEVLETPPDILFTRAVRPRTGQHVDVCSNCESTYGRGALTPTPASAQIAGDSEAADGSEIR